MKAALEAVLLIKQTWKKLEVRMNCPADRADERSSYSSIQSAIIHADRKSSIILAWISSFYQFNFDSNFEFKNVDYNQKEPLKLK